MDLFNSEGHSAPNHERWMISYADFVTLLFAVFVVLFTSASTDKSSAKKVSEAVVEALRSGTISFISRSRTPGPNSSAKDSLAAGSQKKDQQAVVEILPSMSALAKEFHDEIQKGKIDIRLEPRGLVISLRQAAFFASGDATVNRDSYGVVDKIATLINSVPNRVNLEGHTDAVPIHNSRFASNWELSAARSIAMLDLLTTRGHVVRGRVGIAGYADTLPVESNADEQGRAHNRRVDIVLMNEILPKEAAPTPAPAAKH